MYAWYGQQKMYRLCKEQGIYYVDCPVSGGPAGAADSSLSVMIGATEEKIIEQGLESSEIPFTI